MPTRREAIAGAGAALAASGVAKGQPAADPFSRLPLEGLYLPAYAAADPGLASQIASLVGDETRALAKAAPRGGAGAEAALGADARAEDAVARIVAESAGRRVVMLNEAHLASRHRAFLARLLRALRPAGFTHLAAETFSNTQPGEGTRPDIRRFRAGARFHPNYGFYTFDPVFAEAVREAADLGFRFFPYEQHSGQEGPAGETTEASIARREEAQAENFLAALNALPSEARVLVFVGYAHLLEGPDPGGNQWFAMRLKAKSGIDPLTIEQSTTGAFGPHAPDGPLARAVLARFSPRAPIVVEDAGKVVGAEDMSADLAVFHPVLPDVAGRPGWLAADPMRRQARVGLPTAALRGVVLAQAVHASDPDFAVPADQYPLPYGAREAVFYLRPGRYRVRLETSAGWRPVRSITV